MTEEGPAVIGVFGPTGVGKTDIVVALADFLRVRGERVVAISADALQVYAGLELLTGVASEVQRRRLDHRLVSFVPLAREFSVGEYAPLAHAEIDAARSDGRRPIVVGGTGLYLRAALGELALAPPPPPELRSRLEQELAAVGPARMHATLTERAPQLARRVAPTDRSRIVRALERLELGDSYVDREQLWSADVRHPTLLYGLVLERGELYRRIDRRIDRMVEAGAADEVLRAAAAGASRTARKALGFEDLLRGDVDAMKRRTRNYAKRQMTWMRRLPGVRLVDVTDMDATAVAATIAAAI